MVGAIVPPRGFIGATASEVFVAVPAADDQHLGCQGEAVHAGHPASGTPGVRRWGIRGCTGVRVCGAEHRRSWCHYINTRQEPYMARVALG